MKLATIAPRPVAPRRQVEKMLPDTIVTLDLDKLARRERDLCRRGGDQDPSVWLK